jgi:outer membrane protein
MKVLSGQDIRVMAWWESWPRRPARCPGRARFWGPSLLLLPPLLLGTVALRAEQRLAAPPARSDAASPAAPTVQGAPTGQPGVSASPAAPAPSPPPSAAAPPAAGLDLLESVRLMLANDPNLVVARSHLLSALGALSVQTGTFDTVITASAGYTDTRTPVLDALAQRQTALTGSFGFTQELRSGTTLSPELNLSSDTASSSLTGLPGPPAIVNTATVSFLLRQPLLRGRGTRVADAGERAAQREAEAGALDLRFTTSQRILSVASQYWTTVAARYSLDILRSNEETSRQLLATTRRLISADITAPAEAVQLEANLAAAEASRFAGENALFKARQDLGREIGLDGARTAALPLPAGPFPELAPGALDVAGAARFVDGALRRRADLLAARKRQDESELLLAAASNALLPQLDLVLKPGYSGLMGGGGVAAFFAALAHQIPGVSSSLSLNLSWPVRRDVAYGQLLQARATQQQSAALLDQLRKSVSTDVPTAVDTVARSAQQLERAREAVRLFERAVANEERKLGAGSSTVLDVITQRDRLLAAAQTEVSAELALALALAQLRFDTGTMLAKSGDLEVVDSRHLTTVPAAEEMSP